MTKELLQQTLNEARSTAIIVFTHVDGLAQETKDAIEYMYSLLSMHFERQALAQQEQYPLPDTLYPGSKDWMTGSYKERVEWLHGMYESAKQEIDRLESQQEQPASVDAYVGAREDVAIWKKRALEAEGLNRKFIAEVNGPTYLGEPVKQEQPAQGKCKCGHVGTSITVVESFPVHSVSVDEEDPDYKEHSYGLDVDATLQIGLEICRNCKTINGFWIEDTGGAEFYADWGKPRYTHPAPTQPALSDEQILDIFNKVSADGIGHYMTAVGRAIEAHCRGGQA